MILVIAKILEISMWKLIQMIKQNTLESKSFIIPPICEIENKGISFLSRMIDFVKTQTQNKSLLKNLQQKEVKKYKSHTSGVVKINIMRQKNIILESQKSYS